MIAWIFSLLLSVFNPTPAPAPAPAPDNGDSTQPAPGKPADDGKTIIIEDIYIG